MRIASVGYNPVKQTNQNYTNKQQTAPAFEAKLCLRFKKNGDSEKVFELMERLARTIAGDGGLATPVEIHRTGERSGELRFFEAWELQGIGEHIAREANAFLAKEKISAGIVFIEREEKNLLF